jgi:hypothetical protein
MLDSTTLFFNYYCYDNHFSYILTNDISFRTEYWQLVHRGLL